jgi:hypothetical protein
MKHLTTKQLKEFRKFLVPCPDIETPVAECNGVYYALADGESVSGLWPDTRDYPEEKLPKLYFVDHEVTGETVAGPFTEELDAIECVRLMGTWDLVLREYAPTPEEYEELCEEQRKARRWAAGIGA